MSKIKNNNDLKNKKKNNKEIFKDILPILPLIILVFFLPFIIRLKLIPLEGPFYDYWTGERVNADFFTYYKKIFIYLVTSWTMLHTFFFTKKIKRTKAYYFIGGFSLLVILSTIFSDYPQIALHGFNERHEGMWVVLSYMILMFCTINLINNEKQIKYIVYSLGLSGGIISIITIFQFFGMDIFDTEFAKNLMVSREILSRIQEFNIKLGEGHAYGVFYNPNYLGGYMSFYSPLMLGYSIFSENIKEKILFGIFFILSMISLVFSRSEAGVLGTVLAILLMLTFIYLKHLLQNREKEKYTKVLLTRLVPIFLVIVIMPLSISYIPMERNPLERIRKEAVELITPNREKIDYREVGPINDIRRIDESTIELTIYGTVTRLNIDKNMKLSVFNSNEDLIFEEKINPLKENSYRLDEIEQYVPVINIINLGDNDYFGLHYIYNNVMERLNFLIYDSEIYLATDSFKIISLYENDLYAENIGFQGKGRIASGRGYIWSRSLPIMINNFMYGIGQDTFITKFPQYEIYGKQKEGFYQNSWYLIVDKPHNMYIQLGIQSGVISLVILLTSIALLYIKSFKKYIIKNNNISLTLSVSIFGWLTSSVFNDSIVGITPIIMLFIGILCFLNLDIKLKNKVVKNNE